MWAGVTKKENLAQFSGAPVSVLVDQIEHPNGPNVAKPNAHSVPSLCVCGAGSVLSKRKPLVAPTYLIALFNFLLNSGSQLERGSIQSALRDPKPNQKRFLMHPGPPFEQPDLIQI
ncbi:hypothetical protein VNO77_02467 [Canavalia gladiata]|uniref:Uncharacterized protein n=1 Tax=Canavalia gladiata TaxID=3824 RepID=A0AAN9MYC1_CANGL